MLSLDEALSRIFALCQTLGTEEIPINNAVGRYLAAPVHAQITQPPFNASAMDGYALQSGDAQDGQSLLMIGASQAGQGFEGIITKGQCTRIFTGAPLPTGADTVIMQENVTADGSNITINKGANKGNNIRQTGQDFTKDQELIAAGTLLKPAHIALAAAANVPLVSVTKQPKVAILASGDELVPVGTAPGPDQIVASNSVALSALLAPFSHCVTDLGIAPDDPEGLTKCLSDALDGDFDVLITSGGASVGDHDLIQPTLKSLGVEIDFWKIAMRPGKPLMAGKKDKCLVFGLPGNPVSAMVTAQVVVLPAMRKLLGSSSPQGQYLKLPLATNLPANGPRRHFVRAKLVTAPEGHTTASPIPTTDSAHLSSLASADILIISPENAPAKAPGDIVTCIAL